MSFNIKYGLKSVTSQISRQRWHRSRVLDLENLVFTMIKWRLKAVFSSDTFAFEHCDVLEASLSNLFHFSVNIGQELVLFVLGEGTASFAALNLGNGIDSALHTFDFKRARHILVQLRLPHFTEQEEIRAKLLFVSICPEE